MGNLKGCNLRRQFGFSGCPYLGVVHGNGKEALQHFDWISERTHTVKSYHCSLPSVSLQPSRLG